MGGGGCSQCKKCGNNGHAEALGEVVVCYGAVIAFRIALFSGMCLKRRCRKSFQALIWKETP
jgi:hypothetical protein